ncbi:MAG: diphosphate--fructose-6-phosphate 1-phosphotransferase [Eubacteriales bacterium]|nr:diphosphate--fructose-6-phosphate 1-phosphotransferase [Eubacteriales bacterium]
MKNLIIGQSGGPTSVMNSSLYGAVMEAFNQDEIGNIYGMENGIQGLLKGKIIDIVDKIFFGGGNLELLMTTPGAYLGTSKYKLSDDFNHPDYEKIFKILEEYEIGYFLYIGGNHSMDTVEKLNRYAKMHDIDVIFVGIPKTIDNNMIETDHVPGYGSAAKYIANTVREIVTDACVYDVSSVTIVELMGRMSGWLTATSALARKFKGDNPALIYLPEAVFDPEEFLKDVERCFEDKTQVVVCVSEGIHDKDGKLISEYGGEAEYDILGQRLISGCAKYLEKLVKERFHVKTRAIEMNVPQRCSVSMMSKTDQQEAVMCGTYATKLAIRRMTGKVVSLVRVMEDPYLASCGMENVEDVANQSKRFPVEWISENGCDVTEDFLKYITPLIQGYIVFPMSNEGIPTFLYR